jgi:hypothetical protein
MAASARQRANPAVSGGLMAGLIAGVVMAVFMLLVAASRGHDLWQVVKGAGVPLLHGRALMPGRDAGAAIVGIACHLAVSAVWGMLFGILAFGLTTGETVAAGFAWGIVVWIVMSYLVLPILGLGRMARAAPMGGAILNHVIFGVATALLFLPFQRRVFQPARRARTFTTTHRPTPTPTR